MPLSATFLHIVFFVASQVFLYVVVVIECPHLFKLVVDVREAGLRGQCFYFLQLYF